MPNASIKPPFEAYAGSQPCIFTSYSHKDSEAVFPTIAKLHEKGYRIWYDEGIDPGNEWPEEIARALGDAAFFVVFISPQAVASRNVRNEINFALNHEKPFLAIYLEDTTLPSGLELRMGDIQALLKYQLHEEGFNKKVAKALPDTLLEEKKNEGSPSPTVKEPIPVKPESRRTPKAAIFLPFLLLAGGLIYGGATYFLKKPAPVITKSSTPAPALPDKEPGVAEEPASELVPTPALVAVPQKVSEPEIISIPPKSEEPPPAQTAAQLKELQEAEQKAITAFSEASQLATAWKGYETPLKAIEAELKQGKASRADDNIEEAIIQFELVTSICMDLSKQEPARKSALLKKAKMTAAQASARKAYAEKEAGRLIDEAEALNRQALREYESRSFLSAGQYWASATEGFQQAQTYSKGARETRKIKGVLQKYYDEVSKEVDLARHGGTAWDEFKKRYQSGQSAEQKEQWSDASRSYHRAASVLKDAADQAAIQSQSVGVSSMDSFMDDMRKKTK